MRLLALILGLALTAAACGDDDKKQDSDLGKTCTVQSQCGGGLLCFEGTCVASLPAATSCANPGASPTLIAGAAVTADDPGAACTYGIRAPTFPAGQGIGQVQDLGEAQVGDELTFKVPPGTWSVTVFEQAVEGTAPATVTYRGSPLVNSAVPTDVKQPNGAVYFTDTPASVPQDGTGYDDYTSFRGVHFGSYTAFTGAATFPNATRGLELARLEGELPAGDWTLTVNDWAYECAQFFSDVCPDGSTTSRYRVHVVTSGPPRGSGSLDLDVYLATNDATDQPRLTAAQAAGDQAVQRMFDTAATLLGRGGLCLGTVTFHDMPDWARRRYATTDFDEQASCDETAQLFRLSLAETGNVHLFVVDEILALQPGQEGTLILGLDGSIPGPSGLPGSPASGAIAPLGDILGKTCGSSINLATCEADLRGYVAAHEIGHWLGLFHTTESPGVFFDPLADTGRCPCDRCAPANRQSGCGEDPTLFLTTSQCTRSDTCAGGDNLMFWLVTPGQSSGNVSGQQGEVMRLNPAVNLE